MQHFLSSITLSLVLLSPLSAAAAGFKDIPRNFIYGEAISYLQREGIVSGYSDGTFRPNDPIKRAEFVKIIVGAKFDMETIDGCLRDLPAVNEMFSTIGFTDTDYTQWYGKYLCMARMSSIIGGYPDGTFRPAQNITFSEAAKVIVNGFGIVNPDYHAEIEDPGAIWYKGYVMDLAERSAIPTTINAFNKELTRGEMAEMIYRLHADDRTKTSMTYESIEAKNPPGDMKLFESQTFHLSLTHPSGWGTLSPSDNPYRTQYDTAYIFSELEKLGTYPNDGHGSVEISFFPYDTGAHRYEEKCETWDGMECKKMGKLDVIAQRDAMKGKTVMTESYDAPGASTVRTYTFFTSTHRVEIYALFDVGDLYEEAIWKETDPMKRKSISGMVQADIGAEFKNPVSGILAKHPEATEMKRFYEEVSAMVKSIKVK